MYLYPGLAAAAAAAAAAIAADNDDNDNNNKVVHNGSLSSLLYYSKYWRYDTVGPIYTNPTTIFFSSVPKTSRIPPAKFDDIGTYLSERYDEISRGSIMKQEQQQQLLQQQQQEQQQGRKKSSILSLDTLVEYNPSIVQIPSHIIQYLPHGTTYLLSVRVTSANNCFHESMYANLSTNVHDAMYNTNVNHLGLALLNDKLQIITTTNKRRERTTTTTTEKKYEAVIDLASNLGLHRRSSQPVFMDYRLFVLNDEIYLHANMDTVVVSRLSLSTSSITSTSTSSSNIVGGKTKRRKRYNNTSVVV